MESNLSRPNVACPGCSYVPSPWDRWQCAPDGCGHLWDTFETGARTIGALGDLFVYRLGLDYYTRLPDAVAAVSADSVLAAARQYLHTDGLIVVAVGDRKAIEPGLRNLKLGKVDVWK